MYVRGEWDPKLFASWGVLSFLIVLLHSLWLLYYKSLWFLQIIFDCSIANHCDCSIAFILWLLYCIHYDCSITNHCDFCKSFLIVLLQIIMIALLHSFCDCSIAFILWLLYCNSGGTFPRQTSKSKVEVYQSLCVARVGVAWGERTVHQASNAPLDGSAPTYWSV